MPICVSRVVECCSWDSAPLHDYREAPLFFCLDRSFRPFDR